MPEHLVLPSSPAAADTLAVSTVPGRASPAQFLAVAFAAALLAAGSLVARSSVFRTTLPEWVASTTAGQMTLLAIVGVVVGRSRRVGFQLVCGAVITAVLWGLLLGRSPIDPEGLSTLGPSGSPGWFVAVGAAIAVAFGYARGSGHRLARLALSRFLEQAPYRPVVPISLLLLTAAGVAIGSRNEVIAVLVSVAVAAVWSIYLTLPTEAEHWTPEDSSPLGKWSAGRWQLAGAATGIAVCAPVSFVFVAERMVERTQQVDGMLRLTGPLVTVWLWTCLFAAAVGVVVTTLIIAVGRLAARQRTTAFVRSTVPSASLTVWLVGLAAGTLLFRLATLINIVTGVREGGDQFYYHVTSNLLARGYGFEDPVSWTRDGVELASALHGPAFPALLSLWSRLGGTSLVDHQFVSVVFGVPQVILGVLLARLIAGNRAAVVAAVFLLLYPNIWLSDGSLFVENLMAGATTAATWCAYRWRANPRSSWMAAMGALIAFAALTRGEALLLIPLLLIPMAFSRVLAGRRLKLRYAAVGVAAFVGVLAPWMIYNIPRFEVFVPLSTNSNEVLFYANCDDVYYGSSIGFWSFACQERHRAEFGEPPGDEAQRAQFWRGEAIDYVLDHKERVPVVVAARVGRQWELFRPWQTVDFGFIEARPRAPLQAGLAAYYFMMALAVVATVALRRRKIPSWPLWTHAIAVTITAIYAYGTLRFRAPFEPILCVLAAVGVAALWNRWKPDPAFGLPPEPTEDADVAASERAVSDPMYGTVVR